MLELASATKAIISGFADRYPDEVAATLEAVPIEETAALLEEAPPGQAQAVLERLSPQVAGFALQGMSIEKASSILVGLEPARAAVLLARMKDEFRNPLLDRMSPQQAKELREMMSYPTGSAGSLMDPRAMTFRPDATVDHALTRLRGLPGANVYDVFLVDEEGKLTGAVPLQRIAIAEPGTRLENLARSAPARVDALADREEVVEVLERHKLTSLPVVDIEDRLVGVIRHDVLVEAVQQEASADMQSMVGAGKEERALSRIGFAIRKRLPWLQINLATAFLAASVVGLFEGTIARFTALAVLLPVVAGQSGNTGAQALAVTMRGLALREITMRHWKRVLFKEVSVGVLNGCAVALVTSLGVYFWSDSSGLSLVIGIAMVMSMAIAGVAGAGVPLVLRALGQDPAQSSSIVLTTVTDVMGFFSFLGLATLFAGLL